MYGLCRTHAQISKTNRTKFHKSGKGGKGEGNTTKSCFGKGKGKGKGYDNSRAHGAHAYPRTTVTTLQIKRWTTNLETAMPAGTS